MKILLIYFSGTGNTEKITELYKAELISRGAQVTTLSLPQEPSEIGSTFAAADFDMIGIGYPIHSFNAPEPLLDMCKALPNLKKTDKRGMRVFVYKTSGEPVRMSDVSSLKIKKLLRRRGYTLTNEYQYVMPYNIIFRHSDAAAYKMWTTAKRLVPADVAELLSGKPCLPKKMFLGGFLAWFLRCEHWGAHIIGKLYKTNKNCVKCGKCVKLCPVGNIKITKKGKIKFGGKCLICMRCVMLCPKDAISPGLLKGWKVNGAYSFAQPQEEELPTKHDNYCKKAYERYYRNAETKIAEYSDTTDGN